MEINEFVYDPKGSSNSSLFSLTRGTFTMLAGKTAKTGNMKIETPVGTMGIRGTAPHVEILDDGTVKFATLIEMHKQAMLDLESVAYAGTPDAGACRAVAPKRRTGTGNRILTICRRC